MHTHDQAATKCPRAGNCTVTDGAPHRCTSEVFKQTPVPVRTPSAPGQCWRLQDPSLHCGGGAPPVPCLQDHTCVTDFPCSNASIECCIASGSEEGTLICELPMQMPVEYRSRSHTSAICPIDTGHLHLVANQHCLLDLLQQRPHNAQQLRLRRWRAAVPVEPINSDAYKVGLRLHHLWDATYTLQALSRCNLSTFALASYGTHCQLSISYGIEPCQRRLSRHIRYHPSSAPVSAALPTTGPPQQLLRASSSATAQHGHAQLALRKPTSRAVRSD